MKHIYPTRFFLFLALAAGWLTSCGRQDDAPEPNRYGKTTMSRLVDYDPATTTKADVLDQYEQAQTRSTAQLLHGVPFIYEETLLFVCRGQNAHAGDSLRIALPKSKLKPGFVGAYSVGIRTGWGDIVADAIAPYVYTHRAGPQSYSVHFNASAYQNGFLQITAYDPAKQVMSGRFEVRLPYADDFMLPTPTPPERPICDVVLRGEFTDQPIITER